VTRGDGFLRITTREINSIGFIGKLPSSPVTRHPLKRRLEPVEAPLNCPKVNKQSELRGADTLSGLLSAVSWP